VGAACLLAGCGEPEQPGQATQVILPGEQKLTPPEAPELPPEPPAVATTTQQPPAPATGAATPATTGTPAVAATTTPAPAPGSTTPAAAPATTGTNLALFKGRVTVSGQLNPRPPLKPKDDPSVQDRACVVQAIPDDAVRGENGGLGDVFVYAKRLPDGVKAPPVPTESAVMDQMGCRFIPQAFVFRVDQTLQLKNSDPVTHNVRTAGRSMQINQIIKPSDATGISVKYERAETLPVQTKCDIHAWMLAYHLPLAHPYAAVTAADGTFEIKDLPPGNWEFTVWHGKVGYVERAVEIKAAAGQVIEKAFQVQASKLN
jgi:hypothetical protein